MKEILSRHTRREIALKCGVSYRTVLNWVKKNNIPLWAIEQLGYKLTRRASGKSEIELLERIEKLLTPEE